MIKWAEHFLPVEPVDYQFRLYARTSAKTIDLERSWSRACAIPRSQLKPTVYQAQSTALKDTADYKGSLRFIVPGVDQLLLLQTWQTELSLYHSGTS